MFGRFKYLDTLSPIFEWLSHIAREDDIIFLNLPEKQGYFYFSFPLRYGDRPKKVQVLPAGREATFIIRKPRGEKLTAGNEWVKIFSSPEWQILEKKIRSKDIFPLRWRLNVEEKTTALKIARDALEKFLIEGQRFEQSSFRALPPRFYLKTDLDVAIWTRGQLRGSAVIEHSSLGEGIAEAVIGAARDRRFKPLSFEELKDTRIEITVMNQPRLRLTDNEIRKNVIYPEKGYLLIKGERKGWFLPEVFNVRRFSNLEEFLMELGHEKAGLAQDSYKNSEVFIFEVDDFIESVDCSLILEFFGPTLSAPKAEIHNPEFIIHKMQLVADWLCRIQEFDGNIPPIINPLTGYQTQIDWPRLAFTGWALAEFGKSVKENKYTDAAESVFKYLRTYLIPEPARLGVPAIKISNHELALTYFTRLALSLGKSENALLAADKVSERLNGLLFEPIVHSQIAGMFKVLVNLRHRFSQQFEDVARLLKENFEKELRNEQSMQLAVWAELANVFLNVDGECSNRVTDWLKRQQLPSGAFSESTVSDFVYVRGTGKMFEILALEPEKNKEAIEKALGWLLSMQYSSENTFFVPEEIRPRVVGGFRHDYFNQEAWIDAAGHVLFGVARLLKSNLFTKNG